MSAHVLLIGPFGAGKSSLARALVRLQPGNLHFQLNQLVTSRQRRPGEDDSEYEFVSQSQFDQGKKDYWYIQENRGVAWNYALRTPEPLPNGEIRIYVVLPETARFIKEQLPNIVICAILPTPDADLRKKLIERDPSIQQSELDMRLGYVKEDIRQASALADIVFYNEDGIEKSAAKLAEQIENYLKERNL